MKGFLIIIAIGFWGSTFAQMSGDGPAHTNGKYGTMTVRKPYQEVYKVVEQMPVFPGGQVSMMQFLSSIVYPKKAIENNIQGTVYLSFVIDTSGNITQPKVARTSGSPILDDAALAHLRTMPKWQPGRQRGIAVLVEMVAPIRFKLDN